MNKREREQQHHMFNALQSLGFTWDECNQLRRISMTLHSWFDRECGTGYGCIERDEKTGKPVWTQSANGRQYPIRDMEKGAMKRLAGIMARYPTLKPYVQSDPRGAALYILRPGDVPEGCQADGYYSRGICVW